MNDQTNSHPSENTHPVPSASGAPTFNSEDLFQGQREILIRHGEEVYKVRITRNGKLIMNK